MADPQTLRSDELHAAVPETDPTRLLCVARQALARGAWEEARRGFEQVVADDGVPEAFEGLAEAAWWLEDPDTVFDSRERAYGLYRQRDDPRGAGRVAAELGFDYAVFRGEAAISNGWMQRAHRFLDGLPPLAEQAWLALHEGELSYHVDGDMERVRRIAVRAKGLSRDLGELDPEILALALEGLALVGMARVSEGMSLLDEATVAALSGEMRSFYAVATTLCLMVFACERVRDTDRAARWCDHFMHFCNRKGLRAHLAFCRSHHGSVLTARGRWDEAEYQFMRSLEGLRVRLAWTLSPLERLGELRRRQGRLEEAAEAFERAGPYPPAVLAKARLAVDRGDLDEALDLVQRMLRSLAERDRVERVPALDLLVRIRCARGELKEAEAALRDIEAVAEIVRTDGVLVLASYGRGRLALAGRDAAVARTHLEDALDLYERNRQPFDTALVRLDLARALHDLGRRDAALEQARKARDTLQSMGATKAWSEAESLVRELSGAGQGASLLSPREVEVLGLVARGLSNQEIAERLVLSTHTIRRHVSNILTKLRVSSRTAAVARAREYDLV
ncbi:MAG: LuxR C-terminal-related transcriptional regulator [Actinomycetota bacterium]|nr:LuxR C-terminal-related transcriptional regulator [Actinomycetota bacterium]